MSVPRVLTGLWQVADLERGGKPLDVEAASDALVAYADAGFDGFDMADHYGSAELIAARARQKLITRDYETVARFFTKWCPQPDEWNKAAVRAGIQARLDRLGTDRIDLLQLHWWSFEHPGWIDVMDELMVLKTEGRIGALGVTNFDTDHLHVLLQEGYEIATNQVSFSVIDRRAAGDMATLCAERRIKLLAYGTLAGGFLSDRWIGMPEPTGVSDWSKMKYKRFIDAAGGWPEFQKLLATLSTVADAHGVSIANVSARWVLEHAAVGCVIVGSRLTERQHRSDTMSLFSFSLTDVDHKALNEAFTRMAPIQGDCGQEYRKPPFLTATGDLSDHFDSLPKFYEPVETRPGRWRISSGTLWESKCGFSRAVRIGDRIVVSGTTATHVSDRVICPGDVRGQVVYILDKISAALAAFDGSLEDVVRTRIYMRDATRWVEASLVHGRYFDHILPANTLVGKADLVGSYDVEIEAEAVMK